MERLQKVLARAGLASRRGAEELIVQGKVSVNGRIVNELGVKVDPDKDQIKVNNKLIGASESKVYILLNKPAGYVTTLKDPQGRPKVVDLLKGVKERLYPVGRLDYETEGLLLLTNDGDLAFRLTHPKYGVEKTYLALVEGIAKDSDLNILRKGVQLEEGLTAPAKVRRVKLFGGNTLLEIKIHEGKNRQVRRMCAAIGFPVLSLKRTAFGNLSLEGLLEGSFRRLTPKEVKLLKEMTKK